MHQISLHFTRFDDAITFGPNSRDYLLFWWFSPSYKGIWVSIVDFYQNNMEDCISTFLNLTDLPLQREIFFSCYIFYEK